MQQCVTCLQMIQDVMKYIPKKAYAFLPLVELHVFIMIIVASVAVLLSAKLDQCFAVD